jgi:hypothetical protein
MRTLGQFIVERRKELGLSGREVPAEVRNADGKPISIPYLVDLEDDRRKPSDEVLGVPRSAAMKMTGYKTEAVYRRYAISDSAMLQEAALKLAALHDAEEKRQSGPHFGRLIEIPIFKMPPVSCTF